MKLLSGFENVLFSVDSLFESEQHCDKLNLNISLTGNQQKYRAVCILMKLK